MSRIKVFYLVIPFIAGLLAACSAPQAQQPVEVRIRLKEFSVESSVQEFKPGVPYHFIVKNEGLVPHEFMIMPLTMPGMDMGGMQGMSMEERDQAALLMIPEEKLPAGGTAELDYIFESLPEGSDFEIVCTLPGHLEAGMHMPIRIDQ